MDLSGSFFIDNPSKHIVQDSRSRERFVTLPSSNTLQIVPRHEEMGSVMGYIPGGLRPRGPTYLLTHPVTSRTGLRGGAS